MVATDEQTEGRGRLGRSWQAPAGTSLLFSIVLTPSVSAERLPELSVVAGAAVAEAVAAETGLATTVKPPNDVLVDGRKVAGVLAEANEGRVTVGVGVNVSQTAAELPLRTDFPATSIALEGASADRAALLAAVLAALERRYDAWVSAAAS